MTTDTAERPQRIGFIATRIAGTDGVSLEIEKWADVLGAMGHECFYIAGLSDRPADRTRVITEAHFKHPAVEAINRQCFGRHIRSPAVTAEIHELTWIIKQKLRTAIDQLQLDVLIAENCTTIPMNIPLGIAVVETIMETHHGWIAHHHDFVWERERFYVNAVEDYLRFAFPPALPHMQHVTINTKAARDFSRHTGLSCRVIPNVMNFDAPAPGIDEYNKDFRSTIGVGEDDVLILQPTRVVQRKGIEHAIELIRQLGGIQCKLIVTHATDDEGGAYVRRVMQFAALMGVDVILADRWISARRGRDASGTKLYSVWDAYAHADLVTYPSTYEGFGNAFLEAIYFRIPIVCNRYGIYRTDIEPCGFDVILLDGFLTDEVVDAVRCVITDDEARQRMVSHNYEIGRRYFSYARLEAELRAVLAKPTIAPWPHVPKLG